MYKKIIICLFIVIGAFMTVYIAFVTVPKISRLSELNATIESRQRIANVRERNLDNIDDNKASIKELLAEYAMLENIIVPKSKLIVTILKVGDLIEKYALDEQFFSMTESISVENMLSRSYGVEYKQASAEFSAIGKLEDIVEFLNAWKKTDVRYMVDSFIVTGEGIKDENVKLTVKFSVFFSE